MIQQKGTRLWPARCEDYSSFFEPCWSRFPITRVIRSQYDSLLSCFSLLLMVLVTFEPISNEMAAAAAGDAVLRSIKATNSVSDEQLSILHFLYGKNFERALRIVDQSGVQRIVGEPSGRAVFQVSGESKCSDQYTCFPEHHCTCYSFFYETVNRGEQLCCKHQLASRLADAHKLCKEVRIPDDQLALLLFKH